MNAHVRSFTPSLHDAAFLEAVFVARRPLAERLVSRIRDSATTGGMAYSLVVGPRGIGKTHLVALIYHRIRGDPDLDARLRIAWLHEDPWNIASYLDLLEGILLQLAAEYDDAALRAEAAALQRPGAALPELEALAERVVLRALADRTLLVIVENVDEIFAAIGESGQHKLRAFLQNYSRTTILATSTSLIDPFIAKRERTFFATFMREVLEPLTIEEAWQLLLRLAEYRQDRDLMAVLNSPVGRARVRAIHHLAGGNPRIYVIFHQFLSGQSLDALTEPFLKLINELTPYYQSRMQTLPPVLRKFVDILRRHERPIAADAIAAAARVEPARVIEGLATLRNLGYVTQSDGTRFELREPLMRIALNQKEQRGTDVPLFVSFLRVWFPRTELEQMLQAGAAASHEALAAALAQAGDPLVPALRQGFLKSALEGRHQEAVDLGRELVAREPQNFENWTTLEYSLAALGDWEAIADLWRTHVRRFPDEGRAWVRLDSALYRLGRYDEAVDASARALVLDPGPGAAGSHALSLMAAGRAAEGAAVVERALEALPPARSAAEWRARCYLLEIAGRHRELVVAARHALVEARGDVALWLKLARALDELGYVRAFDALTRTLVRVDAETFRDDPHVHAMRGLACSRVGAVEEAASAFARAVALAPGDPWPRLCLAIVLNWAGDFARALTTAEHGVGLDRAAQHIGLRWVVGDTLMAAGQWTEGRERLDRWLDEVTARGELDEFGALTALLSRAPAPEAWAPFVTSWMDAFRRAGALDRLGAALVRQFQRFAARGFGHSVAHEWLVTWTAAAEGEPALALPLKLLAVSVAFAERLDASVLLELTVEERRLLEPVLEAYRHAAGEPDELERETLDFVAHAERDFAAPAASGAPDRTARAPALTPGRLRHLLHGNPQPFQDEPLRPLLSGDWQSLPPDAIEGLLADAAARDGALAHALAAPDLHVDRVDARPLSFSSWRLYQLHGRLAAQRCALDFLAGEDGACLLPGTSRPIYELVRRRIIGLTGDNAAEYVRFFCNGLRGDAGRFEIAEAPGQAVGTTALESLDTDHAHRAAPDRGGPGNLRYQALIAYGGTVYRTQLELRLADGLIHMTNDTAVGEARLRTERFAGPFRVDDEEPAASGG